MTLEDTVVTPLDRRDPYRFFWLVCQVALWISAVAATIAIIIGVILGLVGLGAAAYGWAVQQGMVPAPF